MTMRSPTSASSHSRDDERHFPLDNINAISWLFLSHISRFKVFIGFYVIAGYNHRLSSSFFATYRGKLHVFYAILFSQEYKKFAREISPNLRCDVMCGQGACAPKCVHVRDFPCDTSAGIANFR